MARPPKEGLDYFPLDTDIDQDEKVVMVVAKYGMKGFGIFIRLLMDIYKKGYFCHWSEKEKYIFSMKINEDPDFVIGVVEECLKWDFFDKEMFQNHSILTSKGIQSRYKLAAGRRKEISINPEYDLINVDNNSINENKNSGYCDEVDTESTQKKRKEKKENKTYMDLSIHGDDFLNIYLNEFSSRFGKKHKPVSEENFDLVIKQIESFKEKVDIEEFEEIVENHFANLPANNDGSILPFIQSFPRYLNNIRSEY